MTEQKKGFYNEHFKSGFGLGFLIGVGSTTIVAGLCFLL